MYQTNALRAEASDRSYELPGGTWKPRNGNNPIERMALLRLRLDVAAMPVNDIVEWLAWPNRIASLARRHQRSSGMFYTALSGANRGRPYNPAREILAAHINDVFEARGLARMPAPKHALDQLIAATPAAHHGITPLAPPDEIVHLEPPATDEPMKPHSGASIRDGTNPIETGAVFIVHRLIDALPASMVVQIALWPTSIATWATGQGRDPSAAYDMLDFRDEYVGRYLRTALARTLGVSDHAVAWLVESKRKHAPPETSTNVNKRPPRATQRANADLNLSLL